MSEIPALRRNLYRLLWIVLDFLYPPACGGCGELGSRWCDACQHATHAIQRPYCDICGNPGNWSGLCPTCQTVRPSFTALRSYSTFSGPLQNALHRLKYRKDIGLGEALARPLVRTLQDLEWKVDTVVPIPLGKSRKAERGYNQVALLGLPLALWLDLPYRPAGLTRRKDTRSQVGLPASERLANVQHAFQAHRDLVQDQIILLLDDVTTTGATLESAAQALLQAGAHEVYALTLARTVLSKNPLAGSFDLGRPGLGV